MFARRLKVDALEPAPQKPCPLAWLDSFAMRSFTGRSAFDDVLPVTDGRVEVSFEVDLIALQSDMEDWMTRKFGKGKAVKLELSDLPTAAASF